MVRKISIGPGKLTEKKEEEEDKDLIPILLESSSARSSF